MTGRFGLILWIALLGLVAAPVAAQSPSAGSAESAGADTDPTNPVLFSIRDEFYNLPGGLRQNVATLRVDRLLLREAKLPGQAKGLILRGDLPLVTFDDGSDTTTGLGEIYGQAVMIPRLSRSLMLGFGSGLVVPTATDDRLGRGKWIAAPTVVPVWFFPRRGYAYVKLQDWFSFAGDEARPDVHYLNVTPTFLWRLGKRWWTLVDAESNTNWKKDDHTGFRGGLLLGRMISTRAGISLKGEFPFGGYPQTDWAVKAVFFRTRR